MGESKSEPVQFATWECKDGDNYYWGHYMTDELDALNDLLERAGQELEALKNRKKRQCEKVDWENIPSKGDVAQC